MFFLLFHYTIEVFFTCCCVFVVENQRQCTQIKDIIVQIHVVHDSAHLL